MMLQAGDQVPVFTTHDQNGKEISSAEWANKKVVLYFYPKDDTPGCTKEACNLRDNHHILRNAGYTVYGMSPDSAAKHTKFIQKYELPFDLLVDEDHSIAEQFGVWVEKSMYGRKYMGIARVTFLIENGSIVEVIDKVQVDDHAAQIVRS
ncbi:MAG: thioredoxin-dependent thiol peroxidase [Flavobacteriales bacterium]|nr:thioredoxin-dependent thiol peroxidase [Flavobacteriales bacterium]